LETLGGEVALALDGTQLTEELSRLAFQDSLTGLANRAHFRSALEQLWNHGRHGTPQVAMLLIDLDKFKAVNDRYDHHAGDAVLVEVARRLRRAAGPALIGRLGGDEFAILLEDQSTGPAAVDIAGQLVAELTLPIDVGEAMVAVGASIGIAVLTDSATTMEEFVNHADSALYRAKERGLSGYELALLGADSAGHPAQVA
jgi:diguanylate cyclase (GGDEF)-like protein